MIYRRYLLGILVAWGIAVQVAQAAPSAAEQAVIQQNAAALSSALGRNPSAAQGTRLLNMAIRANCPLPMIQSIVQSGADVSGSTSKNMPPLLVAITAQRSDVTQLLLQSGAHANTRFNGVPPLFYAIIYAREASTATAFTTSLAVVQALLDRGAKPTEKAKLTMPKHSHASGHAGPPSVMTPLDFASMPSTTSIDMKPLVDLLKKYASL